jgi:hypothetical protein
MVTAADILKKSEGRRSKKTEKFKPVQRRSWDYLDTQTQNEPIKESESIWEQNKDQSGIVYRNNKEQNDSVIGNKWEQKKEQTRSESTNHYGNNHEVKAINDSENQTTNILIEDVAQKRLLTLSGHQKQIIRHITSHLKNRVGAPYEIDIFPHILAAKIKADLEVTRVTLKRLVHKNILIRLPGERGRNGCCKFRMYENVVKICYSLFNDVPCDINLIGNEFENRNTNNLSYSSSYINKTTTSLPDNWEQIDFSLLVDIGFSKTQLLQLFEKQLNDPQIIQESINHFAYALENNPKKMGAYNDPLNVFMGVMRKGQAWIEKNYISPREIALEQFYHLKKQEAERIVVLEKKVFEEEYKIWLQNISDVEKQRILSAAPPQMKMISNDIAEKINDGHLLQHFKNHIYNTN